MRGQVEDDGAPAWPRISVGALEAGGHEGAHVTPG